MRDRRRAEARLLFVNIVSLLYLALCAYEKDLL
jgi:hypothetical protein